MSELIPSYPLSEFKKLKTEQIQSLKSCELTSDGEYLCTIICPRTDYIRVQSEYMGQMSNSVGGRELNEIIGAEYANI